MRSWEPTHTTVSPFVPLQAAPPGPGTTRVRGLRCLRPLRAWFRTAQVRVQEEPWTACRRRVVSSTPARCSCPVRVQRWRRVLATGERGARTVRVVAGLVAGRSRPNGGAVLSRFPGPRPRRRELLAFGRSPAATWSNVAHGGCRSSSWACDIRHMGSPTSPPHTYENHSQ